MARADPYRQFRFRIEGIEQAGFSECTFADTTTDPVEYREGNELPVFRKLSGLTKFGNITLKWGITDDMKLYEWRRRVIEHGAEGERKSVSIVLIDEAGNDKSRWEIVQAWPSKYDPTDFSGKGNEVAIETLEIVHEGFTRVK
ncbi:MAG: phage tail protein [Candidatus Methanoperedens sp.]|nr:phage tail protein [Candidatus Methanoperedens sp.]